MNTVNEIANFLIYLRDHDMDNGKYYSLSNLKLQKLLYFCEGYYSAKYNKRMIQEDFQAWKYGPVVPEAYYKFNLYGQSDIPSNTNEKLPKLIEEERIAITYVWNKLKMQDPFSLVEITHLEGSPWETVYNDNTNNIVIEHENIVQYFREA